MNYDFKIHFWWSAFFALVFAFGASLGAQEKIKHKVGLGLNHYEDNFVKKGFNANLHYHYDPFWKNLYCGVDLETDLSRNTKNPEKSTRTASVKTKTSRLGSFFLVGITFPASSDLRAYLSVGPYYYRYGEKETYTGISSAVSRLYPKEKSFTKSGLGYGWIVGIDMTIFTGSSVFFEMRNVSASGEVEQTSKFLNGYQEKESRAYNAGYLRWNIGYRHIL